LFPDIDYDEMIDKYSNVASMTEASTFTSSTAVSPSVADDFNFQKTFQDFVEYSLIGGVPLATTPTPAETSRSSTSTLASSKFDTTTIMQGFAESALYCVALGIMMMLDMLVKDGHFDAV
jgi:hypothetical protein